MLAAGGAWSPIARTSSSNLDGSPKTLSLAAEGAARLVGGEEEGAPRLAEGAACSAAGWSQKRIHRKKDQIFCCGGKLSSCLWLWEEDVEELLCVQITRALLYLKRRPPMVVSETASSQVK